MSNRIITEISELNPKAIVLDGLDESIVGIGYSKDLEPRLVYSVVGIMDILTKRDGMSVLEAQEFYDYNISDGYFGEHGPIFLETYI